MAIFKANQKGVSTLESCIALPIVFLSLFGAFAIAESFFVASKMVHLSTGAAISLRAVAQAGQKITPAPQFQNLVYSTDPAKREEQLAWYNQNSLETGYTSTSQVHRMFLNLFLGTLTEIYPEAASPPPYSGGKVHLERAVEAKLVGSGEDTELQLRTAPVLGNLLRKTFFLGGSQFVFSSTATIAKMNIAAAEDDDVDNTYTDGATGGVTADSGTDATQILQGDSVKTSVSSASFSQLLSDAGNHSGKLNDRDTLAGAIDKDLRSERTPANTVDVGETDRGGSAATISNF